MAHNIRRPLIAAMLLIGAALLVALGVRVMAPGPTNSPSEPEPQGPTRARAVGPRPGLACRGRTLAPGADLQGAIDAAPPGTTFCLRRGLHRLTEPLIPKARDALVGAGGTVLDGSRLVDRWTRQGPHWVATGYLRGHGPQGYDPTFECAPQGTTGCRYNEAVFLDDRPLRRVLSPAELGPGRFCQDYAENRIWLADDPRGHRVEVAIARYLIGTNGAANRPDVWVENLVVQKTASNAYQGAIDSGDSPGWMVRRVESRLNHGMGLQLKGSGQIRDSFIHDNGNLGIGGNESSAGEGGGKVMTGNEIARNNWAGYYWAWQAGGVKLFHTRDLIFRDNYVHSNHGIGFWADVGNVGSLLEGNVIADNERHGIVIEESDSVRVRDNTITDNGTVAYDAGVYLFESSRNEVTGNKLAGNYRGILLHVPPEPSVALAGNEVHDNDVSVPAGSYSGLVNDSGDPSYWTDRGNRFWRNTWRLATLDGENFQWIGGRTTKDGWRSLGQDRDGAFLPL
jgi:parallel beta-helix repeat protein